MKKIFLLSLFVLLSSFGTSFADNYQNRKDPGLYAVYNYFFCNYRELKTLETDRTLYGEYPKSVDTKIFYYNNTFFNYCFFKITKQFLKKYPTETTAASDFLYGAMYMTDIYALATYNLEALKVTGKGHKPEIGEIHILPGGYAKKFTASGEWEDYNITPILEKLNSAE